MKHILTISFLLIFLTGNLSSQDVTLNVVEANGANTGSITAIVNNPQFTYNFEWYDSDGNLISPQPNCGNTECTLSGLNPGRYCVRITSSGSDCDEDSPSEAYGCVDVIGVSCDNDFNFYFEYSEPACSNTTQGFITFLFEDPTDLCWYFGDNIFEWEDGTKDRTKENLNPGTKHCITIRADEDGDCPDCYAYLCSEVPAIDEENLGINGDVTDASDCDLSDGSIAILVSGGASPYQVSWIGTNQTGMNISNLQKGVYCAEVVDDCENKVVKCFEVEDNCDDDCEISVDAEIIPRYACSERDKFGNGISRIYSGSISLTVSGGSGNYTFQWLNTNGGNGSNATISWWDQDLQCVIISDPECNYSEEHCFNVGTLIYPEELCGKMKKWFFDTESNQWVSFETPSTLFNEILENLASTTPKNVISDQNWSYTYNSDLGHPSYKLTWKGQNTIFEYVSLESDGSITQRNSTSIGKNPTNTVQGELKVYPNPNSGQFEISFFSNSQKNVNYSISSLDGKTLFEGQIQARQGENTHQLSLSALINGIYFINLTDYDSQKLIINN